MPRISRRSALLRTSYISSRIFPDFHPYQSAHQNLLTCSLLLRSIWILLYRPFFNMGTRTKSPIKGARQACNQCASEIYAIFLYLEQNFGVLQLHFSYIYA